MCFFRVSSFFVFPVSNFKHQSSNWALHCHRCGLSNSNKKNRPFGPSRLTVSRPTKTAQQPSPSFLLPVPLARTIHTHLTGLRKLHLAGRRRPSRLLLPSWRFLFPGLDLAPEMEITEGSVIARSTDSATCPLSPPRAADFSFSWLLHRCAKEKKFLSLRLRDISLSCACCPSSNDVLVTFFPVHQEAAADSNQSSVP